MVSPDLINRLSSDGRLTARRDADLPPVLQARPDRRAPPVGARTHMRRLGRERQLCAFVELGLERLAVREELRTGARGAGWSGRRARERGGGG